jgi:hypothetical protein
MPWNLFSMLSPVQETPILEEHWEPLRRQVLEAWSVFEKNKTYENLDKWRAATDKAETYVSEKFRLLYRFNDPDNKSSVREHFVRDQKTLMNTEKKILDKIAAEQKAQAEGCNWGRLFFCCRQDDDDVDQEAVVAASYRAMV